MQVCQNPNCSNPFNPDINRFCNNCGFNKFGKLLRNRFRVLRELGVGGFGKTYLAEDADRLDAPCVIKQFFPQVQGTAALTKATELFKEEAKRLFELGENHSQIPRLLAYFKQGSSLYLVQEFIEGETLLTQLKRQAYTEKQIWEVLADLLPVLQFIHQRNVIHRDIKPENIIRRQSDRKLVLIDFGGAKQVTQTSLARQCTGIYTIGYAPIEQISGYISPASDLYALGATCVRLLTQCLPILDANGNLYDHIYDGYNAQWLWRERLKEINVTISDKLGQVLDKLLKHLARERYQSAAEILQELHFNITSVDPTILVIPQPSGVNINPVSSKNRVYGEFTLQNFEFDVVTIDAYAQEINRNHRQAMFFSEDLGNGVILEMVHIPGGSFIMGSDEKESEKPRHQVTVKPFFMSKFPITQEQWEAMMGNNPSYFRGAKRPVESVSWNDAVELCKRLSENTGKTYRLPSEAQWEYACCAGTTTPFHFGETITTDLANYNGNYTYAHEAKGIYYQETKTVGTFPPNDFGLYDMHGNVWEWCADFWHKNYNDAPTDDSVLELGGNDKCRILRGGSWNSFPQFCRSAYRNYHVLDTRVSSFGFRVVLVLA